MSTKLSSCPSLEFVQFLRWKSKIFMVCTIRIAELVKICVHSFFGMLGYVCILIGMKSYVYLVCISGLNV